MPAQYRDLGQMIPSVLGCGCGIFASNGFNDPGVAFDCFGHAFLVVQLDPTYSVGVSFEISDNSESVWLLGGVANQAVKIVIEETELDWVVIVSCLALQLKTHTSVLAM